MDVNQILTAISTVGFPIVVAGACMWYVKYSNDKHLQNIADLNKQHQDEMNKVVEAVNNNTVALTKLSERLEVMR